MQWTTLRIYQIKLKIKVWRTEFIFYLFIFLIMWHINKRVGEKAEKSSPRYPSVTSLLVTTFLKPAPVIFVMEK